jgi:hypothetical protein
MEEAIIKADVRGGRQKHHQKLQETLSSALIIAHNGGVSFGRRQGTGKGYYVCIRTLSVLASASGFFSLVR